MKVYTFTQNELSESSNDAIDAWLTQLRDAGVIQKEVYDELSQYRVVASPPSFFGKIWAKVFRKGWSEDNNYYHLIKVITPGSQQTEENKND